MSLRKVSFNNQPAWQYKSRFVTGKPFVFTPGYPQSETRAKQLALKDGKNKEDEYTQENE